LRAAVRCDGEHSPHAFPFGRKRGFSSSPEGRRSRRRRRPGNASHGTGRYRCPDSGAPILAVWFVKSGEQCACHARRKEAAARGSARLRASLDCRCARRSVRVQAGTEKRRSNRTEKHHGRGRQVETWRNRGGRLRPPRFVSSTKAAPGRGPITAGWWSWHPGLVSRDASRVQWIGGAAVNPILQARGD
jgi:hypothetical protein